MKFNPREWHHFYLGLIVELVGWVFVALGRFWAGFFLVLAGRLIAQDDLYQHTRQLAEPDYHSPGHYLFGKYLYKYRAVKWLCKKLDALLGKGPE